MWKNPINLWPKFGIKLNWLSPYLLVELWVLQKYWARPIKLGVNHPILSLLCFGSNIFPHLDPYKHNNAWNRTSTFQWKLSNKNLTKVEHPYIHKHIHTAWRNLLSRAIASLTVPGGQKFHFPHFFQILSNFSYFSSNFTYFLPHFGPPVGATCPPGRPLLHHCCYHNIPLLLFKPGGSKLHETYINNHRKNDSN